MRGFSSHAARARGRFRHRYPQLRRVRERFESIQTSFLLKSISDRLYLPLIDSAVNKKIQNRIEHPLHSLAMDSHAQCVQRLMRAATWPKPVREAFEVHLINLIENGHRWDWLTPIFQRWIPAPRALHRYSSKVGAVCIKVLVRFCAGAISDGRPYRVNLNGTQELAAGKPTGRDSSSKAPNFQKGAHQPHLRRRDQQHEALSKQGHNEQRNTDD